MKTVSGKPSDDECVIRRAEFDANAMTPEVLYVQLDRAATVYTGFYACVCMD